MATSLKQDLHEIDENVVGAIDAIMNSLHLKNDSTREFLRMSIANATLFDRKQSDYGPKNISAFGTFGCLVRMTDKFERLKTLFGNGRRRRAINESISDTFRDIHNYANICLMLENDRWPQ